MFIESLINFYEKSKTGYSPVVDSWFLFGSPIPIICIIISYVLLMKVFLPKFMINRKAYDLRWAIRIFNICQISYNSYMIVRAFLEPGYATNFFSFGCTAISAQQAQIFEYNVFRAFWHYLMNKLLDFFDTAFFVLRKKESHVTFLHVFHHCSMVFVVWFMLKYFPGKEPMIAAFINATIHVFMYTYYLLSSFGQTFSFVYKLKKYLTLAQIGQFIIVLIYYTLADRYSCGFNIVVVRLINFEAVANLCLFVNFYRKTYGNKNRLINMQKMMVCTPLQGKEMASGDKIDENQNDVKEKSQ